MVMEVLLDLDSFASVREERSNDGHHQSGTLHKLAYQERLHLQILQEFGDLAKQIVKQQSLTSTNCSKCCRSVYIYGCLQNRYRCGICKIKHKPNNLSIRNTRHLTMC